MTAAGAILSIWAHYDDDLIFGNPTISSAIAAGSAVSTVFLTGSDAGRGHEYTAGREVGIRKAYERMLGASLTWTESLTKRGSALLKTWTADSAPITLSTLGLPDGRPNGAGFESTGSMSLRQLLEGDIDEIRTLDGDPVTEIMLLELLSGLLTAHDGAQVLAHAPMSYGPLAREDHSDHWATGEYVLRAAQASGREDISFRIGYPCVQLPATLTGERLAEKVDVFRVYAAHDPVVARGTVAETLALRGFGEWLRREYALTPEGPRPI